MSLYFQQTTPNPLPFSLNAVEWLGDLASAEDVGYVLPEWVEITEAQFLLAVEANQHLRGALCDALEDVIAGNTVTSGAAVSALRLAFAHLIGDAPCIPVVTLPRVSVAAPHHHYGGHGTHDTGPAIPD